ncbi:hypothetical protein ACJIZ3_019650 [Penstemon smallii]|uniref:Response regulatory domain-containing protein n=1 Tax=Penstemon smallii TaxID=265156 RepID=A0ABD3T306_9LAMI
MSSNGNMGIAKKALNEGACFFLHKPIPTQHLINVWQHFFRKMRPQIITNKVNREMESCGGSDSVKNNEDIDARDAQKRPRMSWTSDLHLKFEQAIRTLGLKKSHPKEILKLMDAPKYITVRHVSSHLQKYREKLNRKGVM